MEEYIDDLCDYCPLENKGVYSVNDGYDSCEGCKCEEAYDNYKVLRDEALIEKRNKKIEDLLS